MVGAKSKADKRAFPAAASVTNAPLQRLFDALCDRRDAVKIHGRAVELLHAVMERLGLCQIGKPFVYKGSPVGLGGQGVFPLPGGQTPFHQGVEIADAGCLPVAGEKPR